MKTNKKEQRYLLLAITLLCGFIAWTLAVRFIDLAKIGPLESAVGFSSVNGFFHRLTGVNMFLYTLTDRLGLIPFGFVFGFAILGLVQLIGRKSLLKVDRSILILGVFYILVFIAYAFFEVVVINFRPVLIEGRLEASYPSSTTMLTMCVMPTAIMQLRSRIKCCALKNAVSAALILFTAFMVAGRFISGVHWFSDIIGGALLSAGLVFLYVWNNIKWGAF